MIGVVIDDGDHFRPARAQGACRRIFDVIETFGDELYLSSGGFGDIVRAAQGVRNRLRTDARRARYIFHRHSFRHLFFLAYSLRPLPNAVSLRPFSFAPDAVPALRRVSSPRPPHSPVRPVPPSRFPSPRKTEAAPPPRNRSLKNRVQSAEKPQAPRNFRKAVRPLSSRLNTVVLSRMLSHTLSTRFVTASCAASFESRSPYSRSSEAIMSL